MHPVHPDHLSRSQITEVTKLQAEFSDEFSVLFFLPGCTNLLEHDIEKPPGVDVYSRLNYFPKHKK